MPHAHTHGGRPCCRAQDGPWPPVPACQRTEHVRPIRSDKNAKRSRRAVLPLPISSRDSFSCVPARYEGIESPVVQDAQLHAGRYTCLGMGEHLPKKSPEQAATSRRFIAEEQTACTLEALQNPTNASSRTISTGFFYEDVATMGACFT